MKILIDMNLSPDWAARFATAGHVAVHWINIGLSPRVIGTKVLAALEQARPELEAGALLTIQIDKMRLRLLPFVTEAA